jgi:hypothetical protein
VRKWMERNEGGEVVRRRIERQWVGGRERRERCSKKRRARRERSTEEEGGREVVRRWRGRKEGDRYWGGGWRGMRAKKEGDRQWGGRHLTLRVFTMRYYTSVVSLVQIDRRLWTFWLIDFQESLKALSGEIY